MISNSRTKCVNCSSSEEQREVVLLRHYFEFSFKEISELTALASTQRLVGCVILINLRKVIEIKDCILT